MFFASAIFFDRCILLSWISKEESVEHQRLSLKRGYKTSSLHQQYWLSSLFFRKLLCWWLRDFWTPSDVQNSLLLPIPTTLCKVLTLRDKAFMQRASQKSHPWLIRRIGEVFTRETNGTSSGLHQFQISEIIPLLWILQWLDWRNNFWCFGLIHLDSPYERDKKHHAHWKLLFTLVMGIKIIQIYYFCLVSQVTYFLALKKGARLWSPPFESSTKLTELNFHPLFNFGPKKVLWLLIHFQLISMYEGWEETPVQSTTH